MSQWELRTTPGFDRAMRKMDRMTARRLRDYLLAVVALDDPRSRGKGLSADRAGYWRYRVGDYRIVVEIVEEQRRIVAIAVGHRSIIYGN